MPNLSVRISIILAALLGTVNVFAQQFTLSGKLAGESDAPIILNYLKNGIHVKDSTILQNGKFNFKGEVDGGVLASLSVSRQSSKFKIGNKRNAIEFFLGPDNISATGSYNNLTNLVFSGSQSQKDYESLKALFIPSSEEMNAIEDRWLALNDKLIGIIRSNEDDTRKKPIVRTLDSLNEILVANNTKIERQFITTHPNSIVSAYELDQNKSRWKIVDVNNVFKNLTLNIQNSYYGKKVENLIKDIENNSDGKIAKSFTSIDISGKPLSLADFKGKYVLLDFWGSWCIPCRESMPHIKTLFTKYNKLGLDVLAIAVDDTPENWKKAIQKDGTSMWYNVMDVKSTGKVKSISDSFSIQVFPSKILVGKDGTIIGRYDGSETDALDKKLAAIFN